MEKNNNTKSDKELCSFSPELISTKNLEDFIPIKFDDIGLFDNKQFSPEIPYSLFIWPLI